MLASHASAAVGAEPGQHEVILYTLVSRAALGPGEPGRALTARWGTRGAAAGFGLALAATLLAGAGVARRGAQAAGWANAVQSKADFVGWQCHHYNEDLGEMDDWCRTVGTQDGWEFRLSAGDEGPDGTCSECWCCKRPVSDLVLEVGSDAAPPEDGEDGADGAQPYVGAALSDRLVSLEDFAREAFPDEVYDWYKRDNPLFAETDFSQVFDCTAPYPSVYFDNPSEESEPLFRGELPEFPMASEYVDTTGAMRPENGLKQTVIGMVEMQGPYYSFAKDLDPDGPYLVMSMDVWTEALNFQFVQCALRGWPGTDSLAPDEWSIRVVLKNGEHGDSCAIGGEAAHARCNLRTSWGPDPENVVWRSTMREVNTLIQLCRKRYWCEVKKLDIEPQEGKEVPQVWLWKTVGERGEGEEEGDEGGEGAGGEAGAEGGGEDAPPADAGEPEAGAPPDVAPAPVEQDWQPDVEPEPAPAPVEPVPVEPELEAPDVAPAPAVEAASEDVLAAS